jgi:organic radical activating enzyme
MSRSKEDMPFGKFKEIVDKCKKAGVETIMPMLNGESLLYPEIKLAIEHIKRKGMSVYLATNMTMADKKFIDFIFKTFDKSDTLIMSLDTVKEDTFVAMNKGTTKLFKQRQKNIDYFFKKYMKKKPFMVGIQRTISEHNDSNYERAEFIHYFDPYLSNTVRIQHNNMLNWGGAIESKAVGYKRGFCTHLYYDLCIMVDGRVCLCCIDYECSECLGNIFTDKIEDIYNSELINSYRHEFPQGLCKNCNAH